VCAAGGMENPGAHARKEESPSLFPKKLHLRANRPVDPSSWDFSAGISTALVSFVVSQSPDQLKKPQSGSCLGKPKSKQHQEPRQAHSSSMQGCNAVHDGHLFFFLNLHGSILEKKAKQLQTCSTAMKKIEKLLLADGMWSAGEGA
jgi:hypothetical protein